MKQTIAQFLNVKDFPFEIKDKYGKIIYREWCDNYWVKSKYDENNNEIYFETSNRYWFKKEYDKSKTVIYCEDSDGHVVDNRFKNSCNNKVIEIDGKKYKLKEIK